LIQMQSWKVNIPDTLTIWSTSSTYDREGMRPAVGTRCCLCTRCWYTMLSMYPMTGTLTCSSERRVNHLTSAY
jgi:hypothetical protein